MVPTANSDLLIIFILILFFLPATAAGDTPVQTPVPYTIQLFIPTSTMIHSDQINDLVSGPGGDTIIGTSFGLSTYNGSWSTRHHNIQNISEGLMDDYITALETDADRNLWIGYSGGIQIFDGTSFQSIRDQQLLKETRIKDLQRWDSDMWIATGHSGIHRYRDGIWTWYQPLTRYGPGFYEVRSMELDPVHYTLVIATEVEGLWTMQIRDDRPVFTEIAPRFGTWGFLDRVRPDPRGGVYLSNASMIVHYDPGRGFVPVLTGADLAPGGATINDMTAAPDGRVFIATDHGIYIWDNGTITGHLTRTEGLGTSPVIQTVTIDARNRVWFSSPGYVGFYADQAAATIPVEMITAIPTATPPPTKTPEPTPTPAPVQTPAAPAETPFFAEDSFLAFLNPVIDPILKAIRSIG